MSDVAGPKELVLPPYQWMGGMGGIGNGSLPSLITGRRSPLLSYYPPSKWRRTRMNCSTLGEVLIQRGWAHVDFLSLDVEGHEAAVLRGLFANSDWHGRIDHVLCEKGCDEVLKPLGYKSYRLPEPRKEGRQGHTPTELLWSKPSSDSFIRTAMPPNAWRSTGREARNIVSNLGIG